MTSSMSISGMMLSMSRDRGYRLCLSCGQWPMKTKEGVFGRLPPVR